MSKTKSSEFDSTNIFMFFIRWWKHLAIVSATAAIAGIVFSSPFFITPMFQSSVVMFPTTSGSITRAVFGGGLDYFRYGEIEDAERIIQIVASATMRERVAGHFNLYDHYEIKEDSKMRNTILRNTFRSNVAARRTPYGAVEVTVRDKDPDMSANIANHMAALVDTIHNEIRHERIYSAYLVASDRYGRINSELNDIQGSLRDLMESGIYEFEAQAEMLTRRLAVDISTNNQAGIRALEKQLDMIKLNAGNFITHKEHLEQTSRSKAWAQRILDESEADLNIFVPFKYLLDSAEVPEKKAYPVRWLIVFLSTFAAAFFGTLTLILYERLQAKGVFQIKNV